MNQADAKTVLEYLYDIPPALTLLRREMRDIGETEHAQVLSVRKSVMEQDAETIRACLLLLNSRYRKIVEMRYGEHRSWASISVRLYTPDSTVRNWHSMALTRMAEALESVPMSEELVARAHLAGH